MASASANAMVHRAAWRVGLAGVAALATIGGAFDAQVRTYEVGVAWRQGDWAPRLEDSWSPPASTVALITTGHVLAAPANVLAAWSVVLALYFAGVTGFATLVLAYACAMRMLGEHTPRTRALVLLSTAVLFALALVVPATGAEPWRLGLAGAYPVLLLLLHMRQPDWDADPLYAKVAACVGYAACALA